MNTTLNGLPAIVTKPGEYATRNGRRVTVYNIEPAPTDPTVTAFQVKGSVWSMYRGKLRPRGYSIWHISGRANALTESPRDIVAPWVVAL